MSRRTLTCPLYPDTASEARNFSTKSYQAAAAAPGNGWQKIRLEINLAEKNYHIWLNDVLKGNSLPFAPVGDVTQIDFITFTGGSVGDTEKDGIYDINYIKIYIKSD